MNFVWVFLGGGIGAALRWVVSSNVQHNGAFPLGTFVVNMIGCLLIGILSVYLIQNTEKWNLLLVVGFLGGFTTFSSFGLDMFKLIQKEQISILLMYFTLSNILGLIFVVLGHKATTLLIK